MQVHVERPVREFMTFAEVAELLGVSDRLVKKLAYGGVLPSVSIGRCRRFRLADVEDFVRARRTPAAEPAA